MSRFVLSLVTSLVLTTVCFAEDPADVKQFRDAFQKSASLSVRDRLVQAAKVTSELVAIAEKADSERLAAEGFVSTSRAAIYPRSSHIARLLGDRPWLRDYLASDRSSYLLRMLTSDLRWPTAQDHDGLRQLLHDRDPDIQAMAIEALATLHDPADVSALGELMRQDVPTLSLLSTQTRRLAIAAIGRPRNDEPDPICVEVYWTSTTVSGYVARALRHMTGVELAADSFRSWFVKHGADRNSLWYWQQRLRRQFEQLDLTVARLFQGDIEKLRTQLPIQQAELRDAIRRELRQLAPDVEAKVLLLASHPHAGGTDITNPQQRYFDPPWQTRLSRDDLMKLLEGVSLWKDVDWTEGSDGTGQYYNQVVSRIMLNADKTFRRDDVQRLQAILDSPPQTLWWSARAAFRIGISRLLPAAAADNLDDESTRDGYLRTAVAVKEDVFTRGYIARELVRVGLPANGPYLKEIFFSETETTGIPDVRGSILEELGSPELTRDKRTLLVELVSDRRSRPLLTRPSLRMGDETHRQKAAQAINAHAGRELVSLQDLQDMRDQAKTNGILDRILDSVKKMESQK